VRLRLAPGRHVVLVRGRDANHVQRLEWRRAETETPGPWQPPESFERRGREVYATQTVQRPPGDAARRLEVRAVDGQGAVDASPAVVTLPAR
jgi:hypothetical protein